MLDWRIDFFLNILYTGIESFLTGHLSFSNTRRMYMTCLKNKTKIYVHNDIILRKKCEFKKNCYIKMLVHDSIDILFVVLLERISNSLYFKNSIMALLIYNKNCHSKIVYDLSFCFFTVLIPLQPVFLDLVTV